MARTGRPKAKLTLTDAERDELQRLVRRRKTSRALAERARIVLLCADGLNNRQVADELGLYRGTVGKWRSRFLNDRLDGLEDDPRPGAPRRISDEKVEEVVVKTLETTPRNATHWSTREMARHVGISRCSVQRIWNAFGLKRHRSETFALSTEPHFIEKVRDVVGLYLSPPENAVVLSVDEKSQIQALDRSQPLLPMRPGQAERRTHDYKRHGTTTLFAALCMATGTLLGKYFRHHRATEFIKFLRLIDREVDNELDVHLILDNYANHKTPAVKRWLTRHPRFHFHFIPTKSSWMNMVERWFATITEKRVRRDAFRSVRALEKAIYEYIDCYNEDAKPFVWVKTADEILGKIQGFCEGTLRAHADTN